MFTENPRVVPVQETASCAPASTRKRSYNLLEQSLPNDFGDRPERVSSSRSRVYHLSGWSRPGAGIHGLLARNYAWRVVLRPHRWHSTVSIPPPPKLNVSVMTWKSWNPSQHRMPPNSRFAICVPSGPHGILSDLLPSSKVVPGAGANDRQGSAAVVREFNTWAAAYGHKRSFFVMLLWLSGHLLTLSFGFRGLPRAPVP